MAEELEVISLLPLPPEDSDGHSRNWKVKHCFASLSRRAREQYANYGQMLATIG